MIKMYKDRLPLLHKLNHQIHSCLIESVTRKFTCKNYSDLLTNR